MNVLRPPKGNMFFLVCALFVAAIQVQRCQAQFTVEALADEPFAYWSMNESGPGPARNLGTDPSESATFPTNSQIEFGVSGLADANAAAVRFHGYDEESGAAGFMNIADSANSNAGGPWLNKTIELWFSVDDADSDTEQVLYEQGGSTRGIAMYVRGGDVYVGAQNSAADGDGLASPWPGGVLGDGDDLAFVKTSIESNTPYHVAFVYEGDDDGFDGSITGYLNGNEFGSVDEIGLLFGHTDDIRVGGVRAQTHFDADFSGETPYGNDGMLLDPPVDNQSPYYFEGVIDDVVLYDVSLSGERIKAHYDARDYIAGDFDGNGVVDLEDFAAMTGNFNQPGSYTEGDIDFSGVVDLEDFAAWRTQFNAPAGAAAAVPEPATGLLMLIAGFACLLGRRRRTA